MTRGWVRSLSGFSLVLSISSGAWAATTEQVESYLRKFHENPAAVMDAPLPRRDGVTGVPIVGSESLFSESAARSGAYIDAKSKLREELFKQALPSLRLKLPASKPNARASGADRKGFEPSEPVERLFWGAPMLKNLNEMERRSLLAGQTATAPWSEAYWPMYQGLIASRYIDSDFMKLGDWKLGLDYTQSRSAQQIISSGDPAALDNLSPAEKYDYLMGDSAWTLTRAMWERGRMHYQVRGSVPTWMGICDGWVAAAIMTPQPIKAIHLVAADGRPVTFYPADIKALSSLLWAMGRFEHTLIGGICRDKNPAKDASGHILNDNCFNPDPGTWHTAIVNQVGINHQSFAFDSTYDLEVWNQPVYKYSYTYFNPQTLSRVTSIRDAAVPVEQFGRDKFRNWRSPGTRFVVGVAMDMGYTIETIPSHKEGFYSAVRGVTYMYDLELDENMNILGGEWYTNQHPDFLWNLKPGTRAVSDADATLPAANWDGTTPVPDAWRRAAAGASAREQPLAAVVERLTAFAR